MSGDLRAAVEALRKPIGARPLFANRGYNRALDDVLAPIPEGAVLVTEAELAAAIDAHWADPMPRHEKGPGCAAAILRHLREGT